MSISNIRRKIGQNKHVRKVFNKLGGMDYAIYDRKNVIVGSKFIDHFVMKDGAKYKVDGFAESIVEETRIEYDWSDIRATDVVVDIGANIGGFTIAAALKAKYVFAIEPLFYKQLEKNIELNNLENVTVLPFALGDGSTTVDLEFNKISRKNVPTFTFKQILQSIECLYIGSPEQIKFLKCDCEGYEWYIRPSDLDRFRRIEMEIHPQIYPGEHFNPELIPYIKNHWNVTFAEADRETYTLHAHEKNHCGG